MNGSKPPRERRDAQRARDDADAVRQTRKLGRLIGLPKRDGKDDVTSHKPVALASPDQVDRGASGDEVVWVGPGRMEPASYARAANSPSSDAPPIPAGCVCQPFPSEACRIHFPSRHASQAPFTVDEFDRIQAAAWDRPRDDPGRFESFATIALPVLASIALGPNRGDPGQYGAWCAAEAAQALRRMMRRVIDGETHIETENHL